jgi:hypothetical protein
MHQGVGMGFGQSACLRMGARAAVGIHRQADLEPHFEGLMRLARVVAPGRELVHRGGVCRVFASVGIPERLTAC